MNINMMITYLSKKADFFDNYLTRA